MSGEECVAAWQADTTKQRAQSFDGLFPACCCEAHSLGKGGSGIGNDDLVARIFTTPDSYSLDAREVVWGKLVRTYSDGLSMFRAGCTETQVRDAITRLTSGGAEPNSLAGATLVKAGTLRAAGQPHRWFCVYDTDAQEFDAHSDLIGTWPDANLSKTQQEKQKQGRLRDLRKRFSDAFVPSNTADELIQALRDRQFSIVAG